MKMCVGPDVLFASWFSYSPKCKVPFCVFFLNLWLFNEGIMCAKHDFSPLLQQSHQKQNERKEGEQRVDSHAVLSGVV